MRAERSTIGDLIRELRIGNACHLLATTLDSVADISRRCGFADRIRRGRC